MRRGTRDTSVLPSAGSFDFLAIGCSAGGVEALGRLLPQLERESPFAVAIVLHLIPDEESGLASLFGARCALPVREARDKEPIRKGEIYFAPPAYHLSVEPNGTFSLSVEEPVLFCRPSIDFLFESAAFAYRERAVALLLTGNNADGARGMRTIVEANGVGIVEDPATASFPTMPASAIAELADLPEALRVHSLKRLQSWFSELRSV